MRLKISAAAAALLACALPAHAQPAGGWQACMAMKEDGPARLACFDDWAKLQGAPAPATPTPATAPAQFVRTTPPAWDEEDGCHDPNKSRLSRLWELEPGSSCPTFGIRSYRPISLSLIDADTVNKAPTSENPLNVVTTPQPYRTVETRIQLSVRSKLLQGVLVDTADRRDSLWFGYTQQSYWQIFSGNISRPFRSTDHEPEFVYAYPFALPSFGGWTLRYGGLGIVHQSNGQSLPLSRSWNRVYAMAGAEHSGGFTLQARLWHRIPEQAADDDNPHISDYIGRAEVIAGWETASHQRLLFTLRNTLRRMDRGSARLDWMVPVRAPFGAGVFGKLHWHAQLFTGYGDSLLDYNRPRTVLSLGLSLVDW